MNKTPQDILNFWFGELSSDQWFMIDENLDDMIRHRFFSCLQSAEKGELFYWREGAEGRLAEIIILDQFSRNIYRGQSEAFKNDPIALILAQELVATGLDKTLPEVKRMFAYMPFMHSESRIVHNEALKLFIELGDDECYRYEELHKAIIDKFGRFPHRNKMLGRSTTRSEKEFLEKHPGF